ncbi:MAG: hypothetical protein HY422_03635, partial [Candidatus Komeilibacteria bacterium]|nr:hypothetical protein [Candidatus Komeilibacteria bacterium]
SQFTPVQTTSDGVLRLQVDEAQASGLGPGATGTNLTLTQWLNVTGTTINSSFRDVQIFGTLYGGSPLRIFGSLNVTGDLNVTGGRVNFPSDYLTTFSAGVNAVNANYTGSVNLATSSGNVGIGALTPNSTLQVSGNITTTPSSINVMKSSGFVSNIGGNLTNFGSADGGFYFINNGNGAMSFVTAGADRLRLDQNGLLGIATTSPSALLEVNGTANRLALNVNNTLYVNTTTSRVGILVTSPVTKFHVNGTGGTFMRVEDAGAGNAGLDWKNSPSGSATKIWEAYINSNGNLQFDSGSTSNILFLNYSGNVGIGTTSPGQVAWGGTILTITTTGDNSNNIEFWTNSDSVSSGKTIGGLRAMAGTTPNRVAEIGLDVFGTSENGGRIKFQTNNAGAGITEVMSIEQTGNVGIGTTAPNASLEVRSNYGNTIPTIFVNNTNGGYMMRFGRTGGLDNIAFSMDGAGFYIRNITSGGTVGNEIMFLAGGGRVGIGTTSPSVKLVVGGDMGAQSTENAIVISDASGVGNGEPGLWVGNSATSASTTDVGFFKWNITGEYVTMGTRQSGTWYADTMILKSGNVGIGTTAPGVKLDVLHDGAVYSATSGTADTTLRLRGGDGTGEQVGIRMSDGSGGWENWFGSVETAATTGDFVFQSYTGAAYSEKMRITSGGNVGIGTASPGSKLEVNGAANATSFITAASGYRYNNYWTEANMGTVGDNVNFSFSMANTIETGRVYVVTRTVTNGDSSDMAQITEIIYGAEQNDA